MAEPGEDDYPDGAGEAIPSKTALKRRMLELQALGESLVTLGSKQLAQVPIEDARLLQAISETRRIRSQGARKRHLQYIGKLMRDIDPQPIERALQTLHQKDRTATRAFHAIEQLRDEILAAGPAGVELATARWPGADRQHLRQLVLQHQRETQRGKPPTASRKLFRYLRELGSIQGGDDS